MHTTKKKFYKIAGYQNLLLCDGGDVPNVKPELREDDEVQRVLVVDDDDVGWRGHLGVAAAAAAQAGEARRARRRTAAVAGGRGGRGVAVLVVRGRGGVEGAEGLG